MPLSERSSQRPSRRPTPVDQNETIDQMRKIVQTHQSARVDGLPVDEMTAQMVVRVHDALDERKRQKFCRLSVRQMICRAFEVQDKVR